jgi:hypothetical protein
VALEGAQSTHAASWQLMAGLLCVRGDLSAAKQVCDAGLAKTTASGVCEWTYLSSATAGVLYRTSAKPGHACPHWAIVRLQHSHEAGPRVRRGSADCPTPTVEQLNRSPCHASQGVTVMCRWSHAPDEEDSNHAPTVQKQPSVHFGLCGSLG